MQLAAQDFSDNKKMTSTSRTRHKTKDKSEVPNFVREQGDISKIFPESFLRGMVTPFSDDDKEEDSLHSLHSLGNNKAKSAIRNEDDVGFAHTSSALRTIK
jgi:hypothetical protein